MLKIKCSYRAHKTLVSWKMSPEMIKEQVVQLLIFEFLKIVIYH